jgi:peptidoglycan hydrolase-like protein with peptidoglycan-binding domain
MKLKLIATAAVVAAMAVSRAEPVYADADGLVGGIIGGIIGGAIVNEANKSKQRKTTTTRSRSSTKASGISSAQREANREVQIALNHFGYPVGAPDGSIGPKSRGAISQYQALLGYPPTGQLTEYERTLLVTAYQRAMLGGPLVARTVATHPLGMQGFLLVQRDEMAGIAPALPEATPGVMATAEQVQPAPDAGAPVLPSLVAEPAADPNALPSFMNESAAQVSLASHCNKVSLMTNTNGGYTTAAAMADPMFALSEQFCLARTYAMASGEELAAKAAGFTPAQIAEQCQAFGPVLKDQVAALSLQPRDQVLEGVQAFVLKSGMSPAQLSGTAKVCLGVGYTTDNMDVAIGSALLLTALGEGAYGELLGHHLSQGYGATVRPDLALEWYDTGLAAIGAGAAVFAPGIADRPEVIRKAAFTIGGRALEMEPALPQFAVEPEAAPAPEVIATPTPEVVQPPVTDKNVAALPEVVPAPEAPAAAPDVVATAPEGAVPELKVPAEIAVPTTGSQVVLMAARLPFLIFDR